VWKEKVKTQNCYAQAQEAFEEKPPQEEVELL
jgi:hypothetical protein